MIRQTNLVGKWNRARDPRQLSILLSAIDAALLKELLNLNYRALAIKSPGCSFESRARETIQVVLDRDELDNDHAFILSLAAV